MVFKDSIPFGAPSQLRLHIVADEQGVAQLSVLDAYDQPIGNLKSMSAPISELKKIFTDHADGIVAKNDKASCTFTHGSDKSHENLDAHYVDEENFMDRTPTVTLEDFTAIIQGLVLAHK